MFRKATARNSDLTRNALLKAGLDLFALDALETVSLRAIGARAQADPSLVSRYFGSKDGLFIAVVQTCQADWQRLWGDRTDFADRIVADVLHGPPGGSALKGLLVLLRSAGSDRARRLVDRATGSSVFSDLETWLGGPDADAQARLLTAVLVGMVFAREIGGDFSLPCARSAVIDDRFSALIASILDEPRAIVPRME